MQHVRSRLVEQRIVRRSLRVCSWGCYESGELGDCRHPSMRSEGKGVNRKAKQNSKENKALEADLRSKKQYALYGEYL